MFDIHFIFKRHIREMYNKTFVNNSLACLFLLALGLLLQTKLLPLYLVTWYYYTLFLLSVFSLAESLQ